MKPKSKWLILAGAAVVAGLFLIFGLNRSTQAQHFTAKVERGDIHDVVDATGTINAVILVQVGSQVSGTIAKLNVDFNSRVHKGDIVALIDPALFQGALLQATADLDNAKANLVAAKANLEKAKAMAEQTKADYERTAQLSTNTIMTQQQRAVAKAPSHGVVSHVRMNPTTVQSVVTYDTIIELANPELKLFPGMTAYVTIPVDTVQDVIKVPNPALRYKPPLAPEEILATYKQDGIEGNERQPASGDPAAPGRGAQAGG